MDFADVIGHRRVTDLLDRERVHPAQSYLFVGPSGVGKATVARIFAAALLCPDAWRHDEPCRSCRRVASGNHPDLAVVEPEGAVMNVEQVRATILASNLTPVEGRRKVFLLDEAGVMTDGAANALLKTLEEPSVSTIFLLVAESIEDLPDTIASRCRVVPFSRVATDEVSGALVSLGVDPEPAGEAARIAGGRPGIALSVATEPRVAEFRQAWITVPSRVGGGPGSASELADELLASSEPLLEAIRARQAVEHVDTARDRDRQKRELNRATQALTVNGLELLASVYVDAAASQHGAPVRNADIPLEDLIAVSPERAIRNAEQVLDAVVDIRRNLRPGLVLTNLLVGLGHG
ncbi:MAG: DNA polymerase III subunit delta' [Acidimicrobiia bacterium]